MKRIAILLLAVAIVSALPAERLVWSQHAEAGAETAFTRDPPLVLPLVNPRIIIIKSRRVLKLYSRDEVVRRYRIGLGLSPIEDKVRQGDRRTPEGDFYICLKNPGSQFYRSLGLSYPNREHADRGFRDGLITRGQYDQIVRAIERKRLPLQNTRLGGEIFIHGSGSASDWTWGCIALDNKDMKELFDAVPIGTSVTVRH
jgi:murein L,D-transpeptidase YafK